VNIGNIAYMKISDVALIRCLKNPYNVFIKLEALMNMSRFLTVSQNCDRTLPWVNQQLLKAGLRSVQTFDLHTAREASHDCECPHHGTEQCDCQMVVLLVYGKVEEPATLILHGNDGTTWLSITTSTKPSPGLDEQIRRALEITEITSESEAI
jgi:hypothetical protein